MSEADSGSYTGEISAAATERLPARSWAILGHSERRGGDGETDESVNRKVHAALRWGIRAIVCVGESEADHAAGITHAHVVAQTRAAFEDVDPADIAQCLVAYEPIWAIGSGSSDTPESANGVLARDSRCVPGLERAQLLYGGSVKPNNIAQFPRSAEHRRRARRHARVSIRARLPTCSSGASHIHMQ